MGFMDKVKSAAQDVATQAKTATAGAQSKLEQSQLRKKADEAAKNLGYIVYRERTQGTPAGADADALVSEIAGIEAQIASEDAKQQQIQQQQAAAAPPQQGPAQPATPPPGSDQAAPPSTSSSDPAPGDFKL